MGAARVASFAIEHVCSELAASPLCSEPAFMSVVTELDPFMCGPTGALWRATERETIRAFPSISIDEANNLRDFVWFANSTAHVPLDVYLRSLARRVVAVDGGVAVPVLPWKVPQASAGGVEARSLWRWLGFAIPPDLLSAAARPNVTTLDVRVLSPALTRCLGDRGYAQTHLHMGAVCEFPVYWVGCLVRLSEFDSNEDDFKSPGAVFSEGRFLGGWLLRAAVARLMLAWFLAEGAHRGTSFWAFGDARGASTWGSIWPDVLDALASLVLAQQIGQHRALQDAYRRASGLSGNAWACDVENPHASDPLVVAGLLSACVDGAVSPEVAFIESGLRYIEGRRSGGAPRDDVFEQVFWQVVRLRGVFYRHVVQRPLTPGLLWFVRHYRRLRAGRPSSWDERLLISQALKRDGRSGGLRSLEIRTAPGERIDELRKLVMSCEEARNVDVRKAQEGLLRADSAGSSWECRSRAGTEEEACEGPEIGVVLHLPRERGGREGEGLCEAYWLRSNAAPCPAAGSGPADASGAEGVNPNGFRFETAYSKLQAQAYTLARLLIDWPASLLTVRGIDVCTDELGVPIWVIAPLFRFVREAGRIASRWLHTTLGWSVPTLRMTAHVGEDFVHLLSGMRRVDESIRFLNISEGDRLGHGLAIGVDPLDWARRTGTVALAKEERLLDLVWEWRQYRSDPETEPNPQRLVFIADEIERLSEDIFGVGKAAVEMDRVVEALHDESVLRECGFPHGPVRRGHADVAAFLTDPVLFQRGRELMLISVQREGEALTEMQRSLRRKIGRMGLSVEVNPSSNLLIGDLSDLRRHPLWRIYPVETLDGVRPIPICVGSDDPITFATTLRQEYQLLSDALVQAGRSEEDALQCRFSRPMDPLTLGSSRPFPP